MYLFFFLKKGNVLCVSVCSQAHASIRIFFTKLHFQGFFDVKDSVYKQLDVWAIINHWSLRAVQSGKTNRGTSEHEVRFNSL